MAGFGGVARCEIGVLPVDLTSLDVDFEGEADFCEKITNAEYFALTITNQSGSVPLNLEQKNNETMERRETLEIEVTRGSSIKAKLKYGCLRKCKIMIQIFTNTVNMCIK